MDRINNNIVRIPTAGPAEQSKYQRPETDLWTMTQKEFADYLKRCSEASRRKRHTNKKSN